MSETAATSGTANGPGTPASDHSASDEIFQDIVTGLYEGRYVPGQRLVEADLTRQYGTGRRAVRGALKRLSAEGLVRISLHRGAQIRRLGRQDARDILVLLEYLTGLSARLCAGRMADPTLREAFSAAHEDLMVFETRSDSLGFVRARNRFFRSLVELSGNAELQRVMPSLHLHLIRVQVASPEVEDQIARFDDYRRIAEAILSGRPARAETTARRHVRRIAATIEGLPDSLFATV